MTYVDQKESRAVSSWPELRLEDWTATRETLHMWLQIVGKIRLAKAPMVNHWWQVPLYVTPRGLSTTSIPDGERHFEIEFNFCTHHLTIDLEGGERRSVPLEPKPVPQFYAEVLGALGELGVEVSITPYPVEVTSTTSFEDDHENASYDPAAAQMFWRQLVQAGRVMGIFRSRFIGKVSPVHFFWGAMDLACTRFSGRTAPQHPGGAPNVGDWVMVEGYSHELSSCGFWPGGDGEGMFYAYAYPEPTGFPEHPVAPQGAFYYPDGGQFVLPYETVRTSADPDATLLAFLQSTYEAAAITGSWDRAGLEGDPLRRGASR
ncbi:DUF5996 family protein [Arthrobacter zhaoguopingii]|uniref:DUF5996 family protein n=1 Tax=Arthrobacter zhaoguopingii TaxID=2681491 RepID=UPI00135C475B|nr:DUF5996 family protein [Arthrobacter zhaoguopingii]